MAIDNLLIFSGNANPNLSAQVVDYLKVPLGNARVEQFSDGEIAIEILENVRGRDVFIIQPTCAPSHKNLIELLLMIDACKRSSAKRITASTSKTANLFEEKKKAAFEHWRLLQL